MADMATTQNFKDGEDFKTRGWIHRLREIGEKNFIILRNANGTIQVVALNNTIKGKLDVEASIKIEGTLKKDERAPGGFEVQASKVEVIGESSPDWPFHRYKSTEMEMNFRHLWLRSTKMQSILKVRNTVIQAAHKYFNQKGFFKITPPMFVSSACEGGSTLFEVPYFGSKAFLSQSGQLYAETLLPSLEKVWALTPSFRAEKSRTRRHLTEYWHLEPEVAFLEHEGNMDLQEDLLKFLMKEVLDERKDVLGDFGDRSEIKMWIKSKWPRMKYEDAITELKPKFPHLKWGSDLGTEEERYLAEELVGKPVFVTHYPRSMKAFYMKVDETNPKRVLCDDLMMPHVGETIGASEREWKLNLLLENIKLHGLNSDDYKWYLDLRKFGSVPHSGFGLGIERFLISLLNLEHIRDSIPYPRFMNRTYP